MVRQERDTTAQIVLELDIFDQADCAVAERHRTAIRYQMFPIGFAHFSCIKINGRDANIREALKVTLFGNAVLIEASPDTQIAVGGIDYFNSRSPFESSLASWAM